MKCHLKVNGMITINWVCFIAFCGILHAFLLVPFVFLYLHSSNYAFNTKVYHQIEDIHLSRIAYVKSIYRSMVRCFMSLIKLLSKFCFVSLCALSPIRVNTLNKCELHGNCEQFFLARVEPFEL